MSCLSIVIDCDARHWGELAKKENNENVISTLIHSITSYTIAHMSLSAANRIVVIGVDGSLSEPTIYATNASTDIDMSSTMKKAVRNTLRKSASSTNTKESVVFAPAVATAICHIFRYKNEVDNGDGRILIINIGCDLLGEHDILMNIFFTAHKHNILIDVANIGEVSPILQQASDITGGTYFNVKKPKQLLKYTMVISMGWSVVFQRLIATTGIIVIFGGVGLGAYKLRQSSDSLRGRGIYWRNQEMEDFVHCKKENLKRTAEP